MALESATAARPSPAPTGPTEPPDMPVRAERERARRARALQRVLGVVLTLNLLAAALKIGYGVFSGSVAMSADGVQSLLDGLANVVGLVGIVVAARPPDEEHLYGHERYETLASMAIAALMAVGVVEIAQNAWQRLRDGGRPDVTWVSFAVIGLTMAVNTALALWERREGRRLGSDLLTAESKHMAADSLVSAGVLVSLAGVALGVGGADAVVSLAIAAVVAWTAWGILREASLVLTDATFADPRALLTAVLAAPGVVTAHSLRARSSGGRQWVEVHVTVDPGLRVKQAHEIANGVERAVQAEVGAPAQVIVHVEPAEPPHTRPDPLFGDGQDQPAEPAPLSQTGDSGQQLS